MNVQRRGGALLQRWVAAMLAAALCAWAAAEAQEPPGAPDFAWPYGTVQVDGANLDPAVQPVIALVNGQSCGDGLTQVAGAAPGTPPGDIGKTVYVVDVLAHGSGVGQRPGCGVAGLPIWLWFPVAGRFALEQPLFGPGGQRADLELGPPLAFRLRSPQVARDGVE
jgi:hypothetical protein